MAQSSSQPFRERVKHAIEEAGGPVETAKKTGIPLGTIKKYASMVSEASFTNGAKIALAARVPLNQLAFGSEKLLEDTIRTSLLRDENDSSDMIRLPRYDVKASAGRGLIAVDEMQMGEVAFGRTYLRKLGGNPDFCYAFEARGDSMWPTISDGDLLIADSSQKEPEDGRIFHFNAGNRVLVKRARWSMDGKLRLTSDNAAAGYPDEIFGAEEAEDVRAGGRVIFIGGVPMPVRGP